MATAEPLPPWHSAEIDPQIHRFQARATNEGLSLFVPHPRYIVRGIFNLIGRMRTKIEMAFAPVPLPVVCALEGATLYTFLSTKSGEGVRTSRLSNWLWNMDTKYNPFARRFSTETRVAYLTTGFGFGVVAAFSFGQRQFLKLLLSYTDWMLEGHGKQSTRTKIWGALLKYIYMVRPSERTLAYQSVLPHQPVPAPADTVRRYLQGMEPILPAEEFAELKKKSEHFLANEATKLQWYLRYRSLVTSNYISDWWLDYVYLRGRDSIFINSNFYGLSLYRPPPSTSQAARAALTIHLWVEQKRLLDQQRVKPIVIQGIVPLCMGQYAGMYSMTREPHPEQDRLVQYDSSESRHVCVIYKGHFYALNVYDDRKGSYFGGGTLLSPLQLEAALRRIIDSTDSDPTEPPEANLCALTTENRTTWSAIRSDIIQSDRISRHGLELIERSLFVVTLLPDRGIDYTQTTKLGRLFFHADGRQYWADKSFNVVVTADGHVGMIGEHSWADAPVLAHIFDATLGREESGDWYDAANGGRIKATDKERELLASGALRTFHAQRILFHVTEPLRRAALTALESVQKRIADVDHLVQRFPNYGKGFIKMAKCSPDAWVQMALQLAWFRDQGCFTQTYESSMARMFKDGRTETVRSACKASCEFVRSMEDASVAREEVAKKLVTACSNHHHLTSLAMTGKGVDRHLFALYVTANGMAGKDGKISEFLLACMKRGWKLSTSQTPAGQSVDDWTKLPKHWDTHGRPGGGFGPVADDGYGVSYAFTGDSFIFFHVSSKFSCKGTSSPRFFATLCKALDDMSDLFVVDDKYFVNAPSKRVIVQPIAEK